MRWVSALAGSVATGAAVIVLVSVGQAASAGTVAGSDTPPPSAAETMAPTTTVTALSQPNSLGNLDDAVAEALSNTGYAQALTPAERDQLDPAVVRALNDAGVVLVIREEGGD